MKNWLKITLLLFMAPYLTGAQTTTVCLFNFETGAAIKRANIKVEYAGETALYLPRTNCLTLADSTWRQSSISMDFGPKFKPVINLSLDPSLFADDAVALDVFPINYVPRDTVGLTHPDWITIIGTVRDQYGTPVSSLKLRTAPGPQDKSSKKYDPETGEYFLKTKRIKNTHNGSPGFPGYIFQTSVGTVATGITKQWEGQIYWQNLTIFGDKVLPVDTAAALFMSTAENLLRVPSHKPVGNKSRDGRYTSVRILPMEVIALVVPGPEFGAGNTMKGVKLSPEQQTEYQKVASRAALTYAFQECWDRPIFDNSQGCQVYSFGGFINLQYFGSAFKAAIADGGLRYYESRGFHYCASKKLRSKKTGKLITRNGWLWQDSVIRMCSHDLTADEVFTRMQSRHGLVSVDLDTLYGLEEPLLDTEDEAFALARQLRERMEAYQPSLAPVIELVAFEKSETLTLAVRVSSSTLELRSQQPGKLVRNWLSGLRQSKKEEMRPSIELTIPLTEEALVFDCEDSPASFVPDIQPNHKASNPWAKLVTYKYPMTNGWESAYEEALREMEAKELRDAIIAKAIDSLEDAKANSLVTDVDFISTTGCTLEATKGSTEKERVRNIQKRLVEKNRLIAGTFKWGAWDRLTEDAWLIEYEHCGGQYVEAVKAARNKRISAT